MLGLLGLAFVGSILWSLWAETLRPLLQTGDQRGLVLHAVGVPLILGGTSLFAYGGWVFVRATFGAFSDRQFAHDVDEVRRAGPGLDLAGVRWRNLRTLLRAWLPGALRMSLGFALLALGGFLINL